MKMASQQHRIVRFLMILVVVLLTIFIYASYYSNLTMTIPTTRLQHQQASLIASSSSSLSSSVNNNNLNSNNLNSINNLNNNNNDDSSGLIKNSNSIFVVADKQDINKIQLNSGQDKVNNHTYGHQVIDDSNSSSSSLLTAINSSLVSSSQFQSSSSSSLLLSSSNIRKNLNTNDLIKKSVISTTTTNNSSVFSTLQKQNVTNATFQLAGSSSLSTAVSSTSPLTSSSVRSPSQQAVAVQVGGQIQSPSSPISSSQQSSLLSSSSVSSVQPPISQQKQQQQQGSVIDTSKGISTISIYESGHLDVNPLLCRDEGESLRLFIAITSAPIHREARLAIRQTWGHYGVRRDVSIAFILGRTTNQVIEDALSAENYMYGDLIRGRFIDSYNNLTLKTISALEWVDKYCPQATYVLKTDDDMFINVPKLLSFIDKHHNDKRTIYGRLAKKWKPIRNKKSKYYVSPGQFALTVFPQFTTGPAYLLSSDIIHDLYIKSLEQTYLKLEDVYTTGIVAQLLNIKRVHVNEFLNRRIAFNPCNIRKAISVHMIKSNEQFDLWKKLLDTTTKCK